MKTPTNRFLVLVPVIASLLLIPAIALLSACRSSLTGPSTTGAAKQQHTTMKPVTTPTSFNINDTTVCVGPGASRFTANGVRLKVVIRRATKPLDAPDGAPNGNSLRVFDLLYVHDIIGTGKTAWVKVAHGPDAESSVGWVLGDHLYVWSHRVGYRPMLLSDSPLSRLPIYEDSTDAERALKGEDVSPIAFIDLAEMPKSGALPVHPWPILEKETVEVDGDRIQLYRVAMLGRSGDAPKKDVESYSIEETRRFARELHQLDLTVCLDNTGSMSSAIAGTKKAIASFASALSKMDCQPDLRVGLTTYRDAKDGDDMVRQHSLESVAAFCQRISRVDADGGGDAPEAGWEALMQSLEKTACRPRSQRVLLLVGDAPFHDGKSKSNPRGLGHASIATYARAHHIRIYALSVGGTSSKRDEQFRKVAVATGGQLLSIRNIASLEREIGDLLRQEGGNVIDTVKVFEGIVRGQSHGEIAAATGKSPEYITHVVQILRTVKGIDTERLAAGKAVALTGWITPFVGDLRVGQLEVFSFKVEAEKVHELIREMFNATTGTTFALKVLDISGDGRFGDDTDTIEEVVVQNCLPCRGTSILAYSVNDLQGLSEAKRRGLRDRLALFISWMGDAIRDNRRWSRLPDGRVTGWLPESCLP